MSNPFWSEYYEAHIRAALKPYREKIDLAFVYGSIARGKDTAKSDIDLMIFGKELAHSEIYGALQKAEKSLMRPINPRPEALLPDDLSNRGPSNLSLFWINLASNKT